MKAKYNIFKLSEIYARMASSEIPMYKLVIFAALRLVESEPETALQMTMPNYCKAHDGHVFYDAAHLALYRELETLDHEDNAEYAHVLAKAIKEYQIEVV